jgi:hypothetical protein
MNEPVVRQLTRFIPYPRRRYQPTRKLLFIVRDVGPFRHGGAASLALESSALIARVFVLNVHQPHWRTASCTERVNDLFPARRLLSLIGV